MKLAPAPASIPSNLLPIIGNADGGGVVFPSRVHGSPGDGIVGVGIVDEVVVAQFVLPYRVEIKTLRIYVDVLEAAKVFGVGIYDGAGTLLFETGARSTASTGLQSIVLGSVQVLNSGTYFVAWTSNSTVARLRGVSFSSDATLNEMMNANAVKRIGTATAAATPGVMNATIGTITQDLTVTVAPVLYGER